MALITKPRLSNRQFEQKIGDTFDLNGINNFLGELKINGIKIEVDSDLTSSDGFVLTYDNVTGKIILKKGDVTYSGISERNIGGIKEGDEFVETNMDDMWNNLLMEEKFPILTAPKISAFTASETCFREIGSVINVTFNSTFDRGKIEIASSTNPISLPRSGIIEKYEFYGGSFSETVNTSNLTATATLNNFTVTIGEQAWYCKVYYGVGEQPKSSYGNNFNSPLPAGNITSAKRAVTGVYPFFATTSDISTLTKRPLAAHGSDIIVSLVSESVGNKQTIDVPTAWGNLSRIEQFNDMSNQWDIIDKNSFTETSINRTINGNSVSYNKFTHNGSLIGSRQIKLKF